MAIKKGGLGRGLDSLFADTGSGAGEGGEAIGILPLRDIEPEKGQPRKTFEPQALAELAQSIEMHGVLTPIIVRPNPTGGYRIVAGERRWRAARQAGLRDIPAVVRSLNDDEALELALIENVQREDLDPVEEALGFKQLMDRCGYTQEQAAARLAKSRSAVANSLRLLALPGQVLELVKKGELTTGHAKAILSLPDAVTQNQAALTMVKDKLNVRAAEALCRRLQKQPRPKLPKDPRPTLVAEVEISLREALGTEVKIEYAEGHGCLKVDFYSDGQLRDFANLLGKYSLEAGGQ